MMRKRRGSGFVKGITGTGEREGMIATGKIKCQVAVTSERICQSKSIQKVIAAIMDFA